MTSASEFVKMMEDIAVEHLPCRFIVGVMTIDYTEGGLVLVSTPSMRAVGDFLKPADDGNVSLKRVYGTVAQIMPRVFEHVTRFTAGNCGHVYKAEAD